MLNVQEMKGIRQHQSRATRRGFASHLIDLMFRDAPPWTVGQLCLNLAVLYPVGTPDG